MKDRHDAEKLNYVGSPLVYKFYDRKIFVEELRNIDDTLAPETANERQFEEASLRTKTRIQLAWAKRSVTDEY